MQNLQFLLSEVHARECLTIGILKVGSSVCCKLRQLEAGDGCTDIVIEILRRSCLPSQTVKGSRHLPAVNSKKWNAYIEQYSRHIENYIEESAYTEKKIKMIQDIKYFFAFITRSSLNKKAAGQDMDTCTQL